MTTAPTPESPYAHWSTEQLELTVEYQSRIIAGEVEVLYELPQDFLHVYGAMIVELVQREQAGE